MDMPSFTESGREKYTCSKMQFAQARGAQPIWLERPSSETRTISPGATSRTYVAPTVSRAHVSLATTQPAPSGSSPKTSGRIPWGSRKA